jgi:hypothetical protein
LISEPWRGSQVSQWLQEDSEMNIIEKQNLIGILDQYIEEVIEEHAAMTSYCGQQCQACAKKDIAIAIERYLGIAEDLKDTALD